MPGSTPILGLPYPVLSDAADIESFGVKPLALALEPSSWHTLAISATNFPGGNLAYYKDALGIVRVRGDVFTATTGAVSGGATLGTLPAGFRPGTTQVFTLLEATGSVSQRPVQVTTAGVISVPAGLAASSSYSFGAVHFRAEN